jgi:5'-nucleotidase/UDP-sugar diphosphatase
MPRIIVIFSIMIMFNLAFSQNQSVVVLFSHNTNGILENCHCPERSYGALEKRAAVIDSIRRAEKGILLVDTGDILDIRADRLLHEYITRAYGTMKYDFWVPGDQDFIEGPDFFLHQLSGQLGKLLVSNIYNKNKPVGESYVIKEYGKLKIGITGTIRDDLHQYLEQPAGGIFSFKDQMRSLKPVIKGLSQKTDYIILLSHSGIDRDREIAAEFPVLGLIIGGHSQTLLLKPEIIGSTHITQIGESGYRLGIIKLHFQNKKLWSLEPQVILLTKTMADNPQIKKMIADYHKTRMER